MRCASNAEVLKRRNQMEYRYLFRGKRTDNGQWVIGNLVNSPDGRVARRIFENVRI